MAPAPFSTVCLRARPADLAARENEEPVATCLDRLNADLLDAELRPAELG